MIRRISINTDSVRSLELGVSEETVKKFDESSEDNFKLWPEMILLMKIAAPAVGAYVFQNQSATLHAVAQQTKQT
jgi:hypothetical protein